MLFSTKIAVSLTFPSIINQLGGPGILFPYLLFGGIHPFQTETDRGVFCFVGESEITYI